MTEGMGALAGIGKEFSPHFRAIAFENRVDGENRSST